VNADRNVPFFDFKAPFAEDPDGFVDVFRRTLASGGIILQQAVDEFEGRMAAFVGCKFAIGAADCTNAMLLGLRAAGIARGEEVIFCSHTFVATAQSIHFSGAVPIPVEAGSDRMIDPDSIEAAITPRTRGIMVTQLNGRVCDMERVHAKAKRHDLLVFEDAAQALGGSFDGRRAGAFGTFGAFSFYPSKLLGTFGDAGAVTTDDEALAERVFRMRNHGANRQKRLEVDASIWSTGSRLDNVQAALLNHKFGTFPQALARRRQIARTYHMAFEQLEGFGRPPGPDEASKHFDVFQNYEVEADDREGLREHLQRRGVGTIVQWGGAAVHQMRGLGFHQRLPNTERFFERCFLLPMNHYLSDEDVLHICSAVRSHYGLKPWTEMAGQLPVDVVRAVRS
jgi:dTDP-4-amino-4,6-dideoxygalactose transaminase